MNLPKMEVFNEELMTRKEAADALRCSKKHIDRQRLYGHLPTLRVGRKVLLRRADVMKLPQISQKP